MFSNNWLRRVAFDPERPRSHVESFFIKANDPKHERAIWLRLTIYSDGKETYGETWAILFDRSRKLPIAVKQRYPLSRVFIDPERAGIGVGPCSIEESSSLGAIQGEPNSLAWDLQLEDELPEYRHLPSEKLYRSMFVAQKMVSPHPSAILKGRLEIWEGKARHSGCEVINLDGWRGMQGHAWGKRSAQDYVWAHCNIFNEAPTGAFFEALAAKPTVLGMFKPNVVLGRLSLGDQTYRFDTWRHLGLKKSRSEHAPLHWRFELDGPDGTLVGELSGNNQDIVALTYQNPQRSPMHALGTKLAELSLTLTPKGGSSRMLHSSKAALEIGQATPFKDAAIEIN